MNRPGIIGGSPRPHLPPCGLNTRDVDLFYLSCKWEDIREGEGLPVLSIDITTTLVIAGALGTRDFYPLHHDRDFARRQGFKDIVMNLLTTGGFIGRLITDWSGPEGQIKKITQRVTIPCYPGDTLVLTGKVITKRLEAGEHLVDVEYFGRVPDGIHCQGVVSVALPTRPPIGPQ